MKERLSNATDDSTWKEVTATILSSTYHPSRLRDYPAEDYQDNSFSLSVSVIPSTENFSSTNMSAVNRWIEGTKSRYFTISQSQTKTHSPRRIPRLGLVLSSGLEESSSEHSSSTSPNSTTCLKNSKAKICFLPAPTPPPAPALPSNNYPHAPPRSTPATLLHP
jgi:hypothetical protein